MPKERVPALDPRRCDLPGHADVGGVPRSDVAKHSTVRRDLEWSGGTQPRITVNHDDGGFTGIALATRASGTSTMPAQSRDNESYVPSSTVCVVIAPTVVNGHHLDVKREILAFDPSRRHNGDLITDTSMLGYLDGTVIDVTWGAGGFWTHFHPKVLIGCDLVAVRARNVMADFTALPFPDNAADTVVFDPPYKLNGIRAERYSRHPLRGGGPYMPASHRHGLMVTGLVESIRVARRYVLAKCADQQSSGRYNSQVQMLVNAANFQNAKLIDQLFLINGARSQRSQKRARRNYSTLLVFST